MTDQISETLINDHPTLDLSGLYLYGLIRGADPTVRHGWGDSSVKTKAWQALLDNGKLDEAAFNMPA